MPQGFSYDSGAAIGSRGTAASVKVPVPKPRLEQNAGMDLVNKIRKGK